MKQVNKVKKLIPFLLILTLISACGEGGIDGTGQDESVYLKGTAAVGAPIKNSDIIIKGKNGAKLQTKTNVQGNYKIDVKNLTPPYILNIHTEQGSMLFSIGFESGIANIHPLSDLVLRNHFGIANINLESEFASNNPASNTPTSENVTSISDTLSNLLSTAYSEFGVSSSFDFFTSLFSANQTTFDALLDHLNVTFTGNQVNVALIDRDTGISSNIVTDFDLDKKLTGTDTQQPTQPKEILATAASDVNILVTWNFSTDNIGIAGYNIYQDGNLISTVSTTVFNHSGLEPSKEYCYFVEAFDPSGNVSLPSNQVCSTTLVQEDVTPPSIVENVETRATSNSSVELTWNESIESDVVAYQIFRKTNDNFRKISTEIGTEFQDNNLLSGTEYCYLVKAFDAAGNVSAESQLSCAKTHVPEIEPNNEFDSATDAIEGDFVTGSFSQLNDVDFYEIEVVNAGEIKITIVNIRARSSLSLYDDNLISIATSGGSMGASIHTIRKEVEAGRYFLEVLQKSDFDAQNTYSFKVLVD